jgi:ribulose-bisphosphate carboxylase small chain
VRLTQGAFSFLPDLTDEQIVKQIQYAISKGWALNVVFHFSVSKMLLL